MGIVTARYITTAKPMGQFLDQWAAAIVKNPDTKIRIVEIEGAGDGALEDRLLLIIRAYENIDERKRRSAQKLWEMCFHLRSAIPGAAHREERNGDAHERCCFDCRKAKADKPVQGRTERRQGRNKTPDDILEQCDERE